MNTLLVVWMTVAASVSGPANNPVEYKAWVPIGRFSTEAACTRAGKALGVPENNFRCLNGAVN
jgi:hypothetical protein